MAVLLGEILGHEIKCMEHNNLGYLFKNCI